MTKKKSKSESYFTLPIRKDCEYCMDMVSKYLRTKKRK